MIQPVRHVLIACLTEGADGQCAQQILDVVRPDNRSASSRRFGDRLLTVWGGERGGELDDKLVDQVEALPGVRRAFALRDGARLHSHWPLGGGTEVELGRSAAIGRGLVVIAGPCTVETEDQVVETAERVAAAGAKALRGGIFKPRTSPYSFAGLGERGLEYLGRARERSGLPVVSEVLEPAQLDLMAEHVDMLQIGSRNMHNSALLFQVGAHPKGRPVLLKRGFGATIDELLDAAEYVLLGRLAAGHDRPGLVLCERGVRSFEPTAPFTLDPAVVPTLRERCQLPVIVDPSHAARSRELVVPLARSALAAGADGLIVEVHPDPPEAWCDGHHCLDLDSFQHLMTECGITERGVG
ncbi:MAG: 3-deoxy-7-phosphoheptulonate synthase [Deltaproteobacteria bacterium]|nr:3-deoxy-7-phosphoheptulonate synthase [Deltaproteobacteria bacterium]